MNVTMNMILSLVSPMITSRLGRYFEGDLTKNLSYDSGDVKFEAANLSLKPGTLDELGLPISVKKGFLSSLNVRISITTFNVSIEAHGLFLLVYPQHSSQHFDVHAHQRQQAAILQSLLSAAEKRMLATEWQFLNQQPSKAQEWFNYLTKHFLKTVKVNVTDVHIRYQDTSTIRGHPFVVGLTLKRLTAINVSSANDDDGDNDHANDHNDHNDEDDGAQHTATSTDADTAAADEEEQKLAQELSSHDAICKQISFESLSIYLNTGDFTAAAAAAYDEDLIWNEEILSDDELRRKFGEIPSKQYRCTYYDYILSPLSLSFVMHINENIELHIHAHPNNAALWKPAIECKVNVDRLRVSLTQKQLNTLQLWSKSWKYVRARMELEQVLNEMKKKRPPQFIGDDHDNKRLWWQYVTQCIISLHRNARQKSQGGGDNTSRTTASSSSSSSSPMNDGGGGLHWSAILNFAHHKQTYCELYKRKMRPHSIKNWLPELSTEERAQLTELELAQLSMDQILIFRSLAIAELKQEMLKRSDFIEQQRKQRAEESKDSFLVTRMLWSAGSYAKSYVVSQQEHPELYKLSDKERAKMMKLIDFERTMQAMKLPDEYVKYRLAVHLHSIAVHLLAPQSAQQQKYRAGIMTSLSIEAKCQLQMRPRSNLISVSFQAFDLKSGVAENDTAATSTATGKDEDARVFQSIISARNLAVVDENERKDDLVEIEHETRPLSSTADSRTAIHISPVQFVWNVDWVKQIQQFFDISHINVLNASAHSHSHTQSLDVGTDMAPDVAAPNADVSPALSAVSAVSDASNISNRSVRNRVTKSWTRRGQEQLMSALVTHGRHEVAVQCVHSIFIIPQSSSSSSSSSKLLVAQIDSFRISNELPIKSTMVAAYNSKSVPVSPAHSPQQQLTSAQQQQWPQSAMDLKSVRSIDAVSAVPVAPLLEHEHGDHDEHEIELDTGQSLPALAQPLSQRIKRINHETRRRHLPSALKSPFATVKEHPHKYDTILLKQDNCSLIVYDDMMEFIRCGHRASHQKIVDSFSYDISIHRLQTDGELVKEHSSSSSKPRLFVLGILPKLHFTFSTSTMYTLFDIAGGIVDVSKFQHQILYGGGGHAHGQAHEPDEPGHAPTSSVLDDVRDIEAKYENEQFAKQMQQTTKTSPFDFMVAKFELKQFSLQLTDDDYVDKRDAAQYFSHPLVKIITKDLCVNVDRTTRDVHATLSLRSLFVEDLFQKTGAAFSYLVTSQVEDVMPDIARDEQQDLISIDLNKQHKSKLMEIACAFNCIHVCWNPECVLAINNFVDKLKLIRNTKISSHMITTDDEKVENAEDAPFTLEPLQTMQSDEADDEAVRNAEEEEQDIQSDAVPDLADKIRTGTYLRHNSDGVRIDSELVFNIEIGLRFIGMSLNANFDATAELDRELPKPKGKLVPPQSYQTLFRAIAENAKLHIQRYENDYYHVSGDLGNLNLQDLGRDTLYRDILSLKDKHDVQVGHFEFDKYDKQKMRPSDFPAAQMYDKKLKFDMNSIRVVYFQTFLSEIIHYVVHSVVYALVKPDTGDIKLLQLEETRKADDYHESSAELREQQWSHFRLDISTANPVLVVPRHYTSPQCFQLDLGGVSIRNRCELDASGDLLDAFTIQTTKFRLRSWYEQQCHQIASDVAATIQFTRKMNDHCYEPDNVFRVHVPECVAVMKHEEYTLILRLLSDNFGADAHLAPIPYTVDHIKQYDELHLHLRQDADLQPQPKKAGSMWFTLQIEKASLTLVHDLQNERDCDRQLATLQLHEVLLSNRSTRARENTFSIQIKSANITDLRRLHRFETMLCRVQDIEHTHDAADAAEDDKVPSIEFVWRTQTDPAHKFKSSNMDVRIVDSCIFGIGSAIRHLYDWFTTTDDSFADKYEAPKKREEIAHGDNDDDSKEAQEENWDSTSKINVHLQNSRIILLRDLTDADCEALVTQGNTTVVMNSITSFTEQYSKSDTEVKLNDFKLHFAKGSRLGFADNGENLQVMEPSDFHFQMTNYRNFESNEELYEKYLSLKKVTIIGVTTLRAVALKEIVANFVHNVNANAYVDESVPLAQPSALSQPQLPSQETVEDEIHLDVDREFDRKEQEEMAHGLSPALDAIDESAATPPYKSSFTVEFGRFDVFMHDETQQPLCPKIFSFGFHNFELCATSSSAKSSLQTMDISMLWHANKYYERTWSPLVCPWNCHIKMRRADTAATSVIIEGKEALDVFISDVMIRGFIQNASKWINAFKIDTSVPDVAEVQNRFIQETEQDDHNGNQSRPVAVTAIVPKTAAMLTTTTQTQAVAPNFKFKFVVPKFSMYIEQPTENRTLCKIVSEEYSVIYVGDQLKHSIELKMKYFGIEDYVQESGKKFKMLIESQHSKRAKSTDFLYIYFEHFKNAPLNHKPKDKLQVYLDTLKINYNPDTILALMNFASSVTVVTPTPESSLPSSPYAAPSSTTTTTPPKTPASSSNKKKRKPRTPDKSVTLRLSFDFRQLYINLNKPHLNRQIVEFGLLKTHITFKLNRDFSCDLHGRIGNLTANDLTFEGEYAAKRFNNFDCSILGLRDSDSKTLLDFKYSTSLMDGVRHRYRQELKVTLSSVKFKYHQTLVMEIIDYINAGILGLLYGDANSQQPQPQQQQSPALSQSQAQSQAPQTQDDGDKDADNDIETKLFYNVSIDKPVIVFPYSRGHENSLDFDLGSINVSNKIRYIAERKETEDESAATTTVTEQLQPITRILVEDISVGANDMQIIGSHNRSLKMVKVSLTVEVRRGIDCQVALEPNLSVNLSFDTFQITMTQQHYKDILNMLNGNIWANPNNIKVNAPSATAAGAGVESLELGQFKSKIAQNIHRKYDRNSDKTELRAVITQINGLIKNIAEISDALENKSKSKTSSSSLAITNDADAASAAAQQRTSLHAARHIVVDELVRLRVLYQHYLFNYNAHQTELDKVLSRLDRMERDASPHLDLPPPSMRVMLKKPAGAPTSSVFHPHASPSKRRSPGPLLPPPMRPPGAATATAHTKLRRTLPHPHPQPQLPAKESSSTPTPSLQKKRSTAVHFSYDEVAAECLSMFVEVNMTELKLSLCEKQSPFCQFSIDGFRTEWNRQHNGDHDTYLSINAIQLKKITGKGSKQPYTQMLCPFDQIQMFVANKPSSTLVTSTTTTTMATAATNQTTHGPNPNKRPEIIFTYDSSQKTSTKLTVNEPCGFLLPSVIKRLQQFFDVSVDEDMRSLSTPNPSVAAASHDDDDDEHGHPKLNDETKQFLEHWTANTEFKLNGAKFICLENANVVNTNAVVLNLSMGVKHGSVPIFDEEQTKLVVRSDIDVHVDSLNALICAANQIVNTKEGGVRMHTIIEQKNFQCKISGDETISMLHANPNQVLFKDVDISGQVDKLDFTISFIDMQIFQNILHSIRNTFTPQNITPLSQRVASLVPIEGGLRDCFAKLRTHGFEPELCFEALMKYKQLELAMQHCCDFGDAFVLRKKRGDIQNVIDLLPSNMYHHFRELSGRYEEGDIIRALVVGDNQLDKATVILQQHPAAMNAYDAYDAHNPHHRHHHQALQSPLKSVRTVLKRKQLRSSYFGVGGDGDDDDDDDDDDADDEYENDEHEQKRQSADQRNKKLSQSQSQSQSKQQKYPIKLKVNLAFESANGIEINLINDVMSSSAMPFVHVKLYAMQLVWSKDVERTKGTFSFDVHSKYYNPMIVTMEPLVESSRLVINWNSMPSSQSNKPLYTIKVNLQGAPHEKSPLVPKIVPVNINMTHIFAKTMLETMHAWSHFAATRNNRIITAWKPFYIVNKTGELLSVWQSNAHEIRTQEILPMETQALLIRGGVRAAFTGKLLKYNRLEISFRVGDVASFEQISVFQNRRRKIMHRKHKVCVVLHTVFRKGSKFVYIWSPTEIRNHTARPLRIKLHYDAKALRVQHFEYLSQHNYDDGDDVADDTSGGGATLNDDNSAVTADTPNDDGADPNINDKLDKLQVIDFGVVEPGASMPVPLSIKSIDAWISFQPYMDNGAWTFTTLRKIRHLISSQKFTLIKSKWKSGYPSDVKAWEKIESFFIRPRYHRDLLTIIIQSPLIITNLFPFPIHIQLKIRSFVWEHHIAAYESLPVTTDFDWQRRNEIKMGVWIQGFGQSEWISLPTGDNKEPIPIDIFDANADPSSSVADDGGSSSSAQRKQLTIYITNRSCKSVPFFRDDAPATLAMNMLYLYTKYLFINKTGLDIALRSPKRNLSMEQMEVEIEIFENQRKNVHGQWVPPFQPLDVPSQCDRTHRPRYKKNVILPNKKWKWKSAWKVTEWEYARDFNYSFHKTYDEQNGDEVRHRKWSRIRMAHNHHRRMLSTISCFGGAQNKINNKISLQIVDKKFKTGWSQYIPLNEAVTNMVLPIKSLANPKVFFDVAVIFELHRLYPQIKVIKFYPRYVGLNMCTVTHRLYVRPFYPSKEQLDRGGGQVSEFAESEPISPRQNIFQRRTSSGNHGKSRNAHIRNPNIYTYDDGSSSGGGGGSSTSSTKNQNNDSTHNGHSTRQSMRHGLSANNMMHRQRLHLNRRSAHDNASPSLMDDYKSDERVLYTPDMPKRRDHSDGRVEHVHTVSGDRQQAQQSAPSSDDDQDINIVGWNEMLFSTPLHWFNVAPTRYIQASVDGKNWCCPFPVHEITQFPIRVKNSNDSVHGFSIIRVQSRTIGQTTIVVFRDERRDYPFFQIHNQTKDTVYYAQNLNHLNPTIANQFYAIAPSMAVPFAWNNLLVPKKKRRIVLKIRDTVFEKLISFEKNGYLDMINVYKKNYVYLQVQNRGATKVLTISENFQQEQDYEHESNIDLNVRIDSFGVSLIDELPMELLYLSGDKLSFSLLFSRNEQRIRFSLDSFQIDNQMNNAISNVLFVGQSVKQNKTNKKLPWLQFQLDLFSQNVSSSKYVQTLNVRPQKFFLSLDGATLQTLINFFYVFSSMSAHHNLDDDSQSGKNNAGNHEPQPMYFGQLFLAPMEFIVSFRDLDDAFISGGNLNDEDVASANAAKSNYYENTSSSIISSTQMHLAPLLNDSSNTSSTANGSNNSGGGNNDGGTNVPLLSDIMFQFGVVVVNFDCAVIRVSGYAERDRVFDSTTLINRLSSHYSGELLRGFFNIIGSLEILGNIAGLTNSVRSGLQDFWFEPQNGTTPGEVFKGFGKGTYSLLQNSIQGLTHSVSSLTSALGTGLAYASGDSDFAKQRSILKGKQSAKPKNIPDGIFKGGKKLATSTWDGISGIWKDPIQGAQEDGYKGAIAGFGQGVMGLVCKPLVGVMDLGSDLVSGIGNTLPSVNNYNILTNATAKRLPRMFYSQMNIMKEYKYSDALIKSNLTRMKNTYNRGGNLNNKTGKFNFVSFEGSFETEPNHQHELFIILGNGLLLCRWSHHKEHRLKFVNFYPWKSFFTVFNRPGTKVVICTLKSRQTQTATDGGETPFMSRSHSTFHPHHQPQMTNLSMDSESRSTSSLFDQTASYKAQQKDLRLPLKSAKLAEVIAKKLTQYVNNNPN